MTGELEEIEKKISENNKRSRERLQFFLDELSKLEADCKKNKIVEAPPTSSGTMPSSPKPPSPRSP